tara:strand:+ start:359 stop:2203 length:1845 start_codon:yes stop_codon:yes gene_type:complete
MFIRESKTTNKKTGKVYIKHTLVESVRTDKGPRQRNVLTLGKLDLDRSLWKSLANSLEAYLYGEDELFPLDTFDLPEELIVEITRQRGVIRHHINTSQHSLISNSVKELEADGQCTIQEIDVETISVIESRGLGNELLANDAWDQLSFSQILSECGFSKREEALAAAVIWGRLIEPGSDLSTWRWLRNNSSLAEFFPSNISQVHKDRIYEIADKLLTHKDRLEEFLYERQAQLFQLNKTLFLFDLTNFYFEGKMVQNTLAKRGKSKEQRSQNPLISLALIVDEHGFPVKSKIYEGNVGEPKTLKEILDETGLNQDELYKPALAMDRGIATAENIQFLKDQGFGYTLIERADKSSEYMDEFSGLDGFEQIVDSQGQTVHLKKLNGKVLCKSEARSEKELAIYEKKITKLEKDLDAMIKVIESGRLKGEKKISERIGKIKAKNPGFNKLVDLQINEDCTQIQYSRKEDAKKTSGCYVINYDQINGNAEQVWRIYTTLTTVENAFRSMKSDLGTRPVFHRKTERTEAHLFISILAYHMLNNIEYRLKMKNSSIRFASLRRIVANHRRTVIQWTDKKSKVWQKHCSSKPEPEVLDIYRKLAIKNPLQDKIYLTQNNKM